MKIISFITLAVFAVSAFSSLSFARVENSLKTELYDLNVPVEEIELQKVVLERVDWD